MSGTKPDLKKWLNIAEGAARQSGKFLLQAQEASREVRSDRGKDVKILADVQSEKIIVDFLKKETPFPILAEESGMLGLRLKGGLMWVVDPLDGSFNFLHGIPVSCISIGLWGSQESLLGVVYDFNKDELFSGIAGECAWLNGKEIRVSVTSHKEKAVLCTGFPVNSDFSLDGISTFIQQIQAFKKIRMLGSAALSLAYVASGRADAYYENGIMIWDVAAGLAIVTGGGGRIQTILSSKKDTFTVHASNSYLQGFV